MGSEEPSGALGAHMDTAPWGPRRAHGPSGPWASPCWALGPATVRDELETHSLYMMVQPMPQQMLEHMQAAYNDLRLAFCIKSCVGLGMGRVTSLRRVTNIRRLPAESKRSHRLLTFTSGVLCHCPYGISQWNQPVCLKRVDSRWSATHNGDKTVADIKAPPTDR